MIGSQRHDKELCWSLQGLAFSVSLAFYLECLGAHLVLFLLLEDALAHRKTMKGER